MENNTMRENTPVEIKRVDQTLTRIERELKDKVEKSIFDSEMERLEEKVAYIKEEQAKLDKKVSTPHLCLNATNILENDRSIKRLYVWQAGVGFSILVFFLTMGVAALRFIDRMEFVVASHGKSIEKLEMRLDEANKKENELKNLILKALDDKKAVDFLDR
jgi:hypothetical protein